MKKAIITGICSFLVAIMSFVMPVFAEEANLSGTNKSEAEMEDDTLAEGGEPGESVEPGEEPGESVEPGEDEEPEEKKLISDLKNLKLVLKGGNSYVYTGKAIIPTITKVTFTDKMGQATETVKVKAVKYLNNIKIGKADIEISIEGYEGTVVIQDVFQIVFGNVASVKTTPIAYNKTKLSWGKVAGANGYVIYRSTKSTSGFKTLKTITKGTTTSYTDGSVKMGTTYYYKMRAYRLVNGKKVYSAYTKVVKQKAQVATAKISSAKRASYNSLKVSWEKVSGASGYAVYRSTSEKGTYTKIATVKGGTKQTYTDKKCSCGVTYYYKVAAYRTSKGKNYYGSKSTFISAKTTPEKISFTENSMSDDTKAKLYWKKSSGATGYTIYRSTQNSSGYVEIKNITNVKTVKWTNSGLDEKQIYYYKIRPYVVRNNKKIYGSYSSVFKKELVSEKEMAIRKYTNVAYRSGGVTPKGWDCSGFTQWAMKYLYGIEIGRNSAQQASGGKAVSKTDRSKWQFGDILVYSSGGRVNHVALYIGNNKIMHALNTKYDTIIQDVDYYENWDKKNNLKCVRRYR